MSNTLKDPSAERQRIQDMRQARRKMRDDLRMDNYTQGTYWQDRADLMYYHYVDYIMRTIARDATSMIDVGTANCPYQEWFDWIPERISFDQAPPYHSDNVTGVQGDFLTHDFGRRFDVATCLQVLEHIPQVETFARRLLEISDLVIVSVPYKWPAFMLDEHLHDPVDETKLDQWMGQKANYSVIVEEPFRARKRMIAVYAADSKRGWGKKDFKQRIQRDRMLGST